jgi:RNase adapter protein RapZ
MITILTWGQSKRKDYPKTDLTVDCLNLDNPPQVLWGLDGRAAEIRIAIAGQLVREPKLTRWFGAVQRIILRKAENTQDLTIGFFCQGGRHRSVSIAEMTRQILCNKKFYVNVQHLELS